jgi:glycosyltransferase involved in cell wall biosynthesis
MDLNQITPLLITFNEASNLRATLEGVKWAKRIVIVDSGSTDATLEIASQFEQVEVFYRPFDHFADQCNFGLAKVESKWTLSLDADYFCSATFVDELRGLEVGNWSGFRASFRYCIYSKPLRGSLYPPRTVLYRTKSAEYRRDGHAHRVDVSGSVGELKNKIDHDDHKALHGWFVSQAKYAKLEAEKLLTPGVKLGWKDRLRTKIVLAPLLTLIYCLFAKGLVLDGWAGWYYAMQRVLAEFMLSLALLDRKLRKQGRLRD